MHEQLEEADFKVFSGARLGSARFSHFIFGLTVWDRFADTRNVSSPTNRVLISPDWNDNMTIAAAVSSSEGGVLVASASNAVRAQFMRNCGPFGGSIQEASGGADALAKLESGIWQVLFLDRRLPDLDAEELLGVIQNRFPGTEVVMLDSDSAVGPDTMAAPEWERWLGSSRNVARGVPVSEVGTETRDVEIPPSTAAVAQTMRIAPLPGMIGESAAMQHVYRLTRLVARHAVSVLIVGATGTGKELVARAVHQLSRRAAQPFVVVNCAAIPDALLESELFGYTRGAFTGAQQSYAGRIQAAQGGTLFLDEVGELPLSLQAKLLRFLDRKEIQRLGSAETLHMDVRVVAATNRALERMIAEETFRADLYYRLAAFPLELPPLAERREDIIPLAEFFLDVQARRSEE